MNRTDGDAHADTGAARIRAALTDAQQASERVTSSVGVLLQHADTALIQLDEAGQLLAANARALALLECPNVEALGVFLGKPPNDLTPALVALRDGAPTARATVVMDGHGGAPRHFHADLHALHGKGGVDCIGIVTNPRALQAIEADIRLAGQIRELARRYRTLAHEVRAPLSAMLVNVELLNECLQQQGGDSALQQRQASYVKVLKQELARLNRYLHDMLTETGSRIQRQEPFDLRALIVDLAALVSAQARRQGVDVTTGLPVEAPIILGHPDRLKEAFLNIVVNALQAMPEGGRLIMHLDASNGRAEVSFRDTGPGIPDDVVARLSDLPGSTKLGGHGIGLHVARGLVELNGGELHIAGKPGRGTTVRIELPLTSEHW